MNCPKCGAKEVDSLAQEIISDVFRCVQFDEDGDPWLDRTKATCLVKSRLATVTAERDRLKGISRLLNDVKQDTTPEGVQSIIEAHCAYIDELERQLATVIADCKHALSEALDALSWVFDEVDDESRELLSATIKLCGETRAKLITAATPRRGEG